ncbi:MAG: GlsB/YeaQ/YmgE family stress response membrane protein [Tepidisphaeraceae bacterium]
MGIISWIILGLLAGFVASKVVTGQSQGVALDIVFGVVGALIGGWLFNALGAVRATGFNFWSLFVAVIGAVVLLVIWHAVRGRLSRT